MFKNIIKSFIGLFFVLVFAGLTSFVSKQTNALDGELSIRIEQPKSPTNQDNFNLIFVTLDIQEQPITVKCFKKGPSDGGFSQFGANIAVSAGGNTGNCPVNSSIINTNGTYQFYASATTVSDTADSTIDSVDFNTSGPGTPSEFSKDRISSCQYKISYKTADDSGKTVKVELYRSDNQTFNADYGTRVDTHTLGSNTTDSFTNSIPDCNKTYFYVLRAFDSSGNGSGLVGDALVTVTTSSTTTSTTPETGGAILVGQGTGEILGKKSQDITSTSTDEGKLGEVKGEKSQESITPTPLAEKVLNSKNILLGLLALVIVASGGYYFYKRSKKA